MQQFSSITYRYIARNRKRLVCSLHEDVISFTVQTKDGITTTHQYAYSDICRIHLGLPDVSWHTLDIYFKDKTRLHFKSVIFFTEKRAGELRRLKINEADNALVRESQKDYNEFVIALHRRLSMCKGHKEIRFTHGNPGKKVLIGSFLMALLILIPTTWYLGYYKQFFFFVIALIFLFLFNLKINFRKNYSPEAIPQKYLPWLL